jgi:hypothetical protein
MQTATKAQGMLKQVIAVNNAKGPDSKGWYTALCPFHTDIKHPNLRFRQTGFICMACNEKGNLQKLALKLGVLPLPKTHVRKQIVQTYDYKDENNNLLFQVVRYIPKTFRQRRPNNKDGWAWNLKGVKQVLYVRRTWKLFGYWA